MSNSYGRRKRLPHLRLWGRHSACLGFAIAVSIAPAIHAADITVVTSGAFTAPYLELVPQYERATHNKLKTEYGASIGSTPDTIPHRLERNEAIDVVIMSAPVLDDLIRQGKVRAGTRVDLVRSSIGMAVKAGSPKPDIHDLESLKRTLLAARSIAYSGSASGVYLSTELFPKLGIAAQVNPKSRKIEGERVGAVVARGEAEIGFQQISELMPVKGIDIVGPLPAGAQRVTIFAAGIPVSSKEPKAAKNLIDWLSSPGSIAVIRKDGLEPVH